MRPWLLVLVAGCSFKAGNPGSSGQVDDAAIDGETNGDGEGPDAPELPNKVRRIDIVDAQVVGSHTDFPLLISITAPWLESMANGGDVQRADGFDIYFSSDKDGTTRLAHEIEAYGPMAGRLIAWVKVPTLDTQTSLFLHYGDPAITTDQSNAAQVWTNGYQLVVHLNGTGDSTSNAAAVPGSATGSPDGKIGIARIYDGVSSYSNAQSAAAIDDIFTAGGTIEAWLKPTTTGGGGFGRVMEKTEWGLLMDNSNVIDGLSFYHSSTQTNYIGQWHVPTIPNLIGNWHHIALTYNQDNVANVPTAVVDGAGVVVTEDDPPNGTMSSDAAQLFVIGNRADQARGFDGMLDEIRASSVARSSAWLTTQFNNQASPSAFYTVSAPL